MGDAAWAVTALLALGFFIAAASSSGALTVGWLVLAVATAGLAVIRFRAARKPPQ